MGEDEYDPPIILGRPFLNIIKTLSRSGQEEDNATATIGGKSSRTDG